MVLFGSAVSTWSEEYLELTAPNQQLHKGRGLVNYLLQKLRLTKGAHA